MHRIADLSDEVQATYDWLLNTGPVTEAQLKKQYGADAANRAKRIVATGLACWDPRGRLVPESPALAFGGSLLDRARQHLNNFRAFTQRIDDYYEHVLPALVESNRFVLPVTDPEQVKRRFFEVKRRAQKELRGTITAPVQTGMVDDPEGEELDRSMRARGVRYRTMMERAVLANLNDDLVAQQELLKGLAYGEELYVTGVPLNKMLIADRSVALVGVKDPAGEVLALTLHYPALVMHYVEVFDATAQRASRLLTDDSGQIAVTHKFGLSADEINMLSMFANGASWSAIGRPFRLKERAVRDRINAIKDKVGAVSTDHMVYRAMQEGVIT
ncbi:hypothetical protein ACFWYW_11995 [Nonomuraea sp. NPDC059023]|uniref:hypothetical protein n=1 Tax=unclassified Nonomuraea TaxID=2593643 RepID=UPI0036A60DBA